MSAATPEMDQRPEASEGGGEVLKPDYVGSKPVAEDVGEAGNELVLDGGRTHEVRVVAPGHVVDEGGDCAGGGEGNGESGEKLVTAREDDPKGENGCEGQKEVRLEGAEPERGSGQEGVAAMEAEKQNEAEEGEERGLAHGEADDGGGKAESEPVDAIWGRAVELANDADGDEQAGQEEEGPENAGEAQAEKAEGVGDGQRPGRVAHDEDGSGVNTGAETGRVLEGIDSVAVIGITVVDKLMAGCPVGDEIASGSLFA